MNGINLAELQSIFESIIEEFYPHKHTKDWIAIDGKKFKNTLTNYSNEHQNILVIKAESFESKQSSENAQVKSMIQTCGLVNKIFTLDALHCSKDTTYYISSEKLNAEIFAERIKGHWLIENIVIVIKSSH